MQPNALIECRNAKSVRTIVESLLESLDAFYERILQDIDKRDQQQAFTALQWLSFAVRDISVDELAEVIIVRLEQVPYLDVNEHFADSKDVLKILPAGLTSKVSLI
jgi:hypothetical protein